MKRILIVTDAWHPQINGVVTTLTQTRLNLEKMGYQVKMLSPDLYSTIPCPSYPEISLSLVTPKTIRQQIHAYNPHAIHIATEGPLGWLARRTCLKQKFPFTTSYHTRFPEYVRMRFPVPMGLSYKVVRSFHNKAIKTLVATDTLKGELEERKFSRTALWSRGVDTSLFKPRDKGFLDAPRPISMYVGRVAVEKNLPAFLDLDIKGTKFVVGDGPALADLKARYPQVRFTGYKKGEELAKHVAAADVFVFPSMTDTFGVVLLEAMACGVPVAAHPVTGPISIVKNGENGYLDKNLKKAVKKALKVDPESCIRFAMDHSWQRCTNQFLQHLAIGREPIVYN